MRNHTKCKVTSFTDLDGTTQALNFRVTVLENDVNSSVAVIIKVSRSPLQPVPKSPGTPISMNKLTLTSHQLVVIGSTTLSA